MLDAVSLRGGLFRAQKLFVEDTIDSNIRLLLEYQPTILQGYPSYLEYLAEKLPAYVENSPKIPILFTSSELLTHHARNRLELAFSGKVTDIYGSTEFKEIAVQCEYGRYHINFESVFIESVPDSKSGTTHLLVTTLLNKAMPLIRYDIGDHGKVENCECPCGRHGPCLSDLHGRKSELIRFSDGTAITTFVLTSAIGAYEEIRNYTIVHREPDEIVLRAYAEPELSLDRRDQLLRNLKTLLPATINVSFEPLKERLPEGKRIVVTREVAPD